MTDNYDFYSKYNFKELTDDMKNKDRNEFVKETQETLYNLPLDIIQKYSNVAIFRTHCLDYLHDEDYSNYLKIMTYSEDNIESNIEMKFIANTLYNFEGIDITSIYKATHPVLDKMSKQYFLCGSLIEINNINSAKYRNMVTLNIIMESYDTMLEILKHNYSKIDEHFLPSVDEFINKLNNRKTENNNYKNYELIKQYKLIKPQDELKGKHKLERIHQMTTIIRYITSNDELRNSYNEKFIDIREHVNQNLKDNIMDDEELNVISNNKMYNIINNILDNKDINISSFKCDLSYKSIDDFINYYFDKPSFNCNVGDIEENFWEKWENNNEKLYNLILNNYSNTRNLLLDELKKIE